MDWDSIAISIAPVLALILGNAAFIIPLFLWNRSESRSDYRHLEASVNANLQGIREEMKDFHGRLERQDAEFKAHIMHCHEGRKR